MAKETRNNTENQIERRFITRAVKSETEGRKIYGYAAVYNQRSEDLGGFIETIALGAFKDVLDQDVRALLNHDPNHILGRTLAGTLRLFEDSTGLGFEIDLPNSPSGQNALESVRRGDVDQGSFSFTITSNDDTWTPPATSDDLPIRTILRIKRLYDVSIVTFAAYSTTTAQVRSRAKGFLISETNAETVAARLQQQRRLEIDLLELAV